ncbi:cell adhesion molecule CEACAM20-like isoform X2 [Trachinotus anak]|uniref:cell adhesion molecule CEACAM20-like isoform X2 n=1 Tax=Trachinotus anak TaxID=443729 RepID=UPI0039F1A5EF
MKTVDILMLYVSNLVTCSLHHRYHRLNLRPVSALSSPQDAAQAGCSPGGPVYAPVDKAAGGGLTSWDFSDGKRRTPVAALSSIMSVVGTPYRERASVKESGGSLTPSSLLSHMAEIIPCTKITGPTSTLIAGNSTANLSCQAKTGSMMTRTWLKDGKPLAASSRLVFSADRSSMMISPLQKEDNGDYTCQLTNPVSSDAASYKMVVNFGPEPVMVTGQDAVEVNDHLTLTCSAASTPPANFIWKFNGMMTDMKTAQYTIEKASVGDAGTYTCVHRGVQAHSVCHRDEEQEVWFEVRVNSDGRNMESSISHELCSPTYQRISPACRDQDQVYSTLTNTQHTGHR